jgi:hypothetical protein
LSKGASFAQGLSRRSWCRLRVRKLTAAALLALRSGRLVNDKQESISEKWPLGDYFWARWIKNHLLQDPRHDGLYKSPASSPVQEAN